MSENRKVLEMLDLLQKQINAIYAMVSDSPAPIQKAPNMPMFKPSVPMFNAPANPAPPLIPVPNMFNSVNIPAPTINIPAPSEIGGRGRKSAEHYFPRLVIALANAREQRKSAVFKAEGYDTLPEKSRDSILNKWIESLNDADKSAVNKLLNLIRA